MPIKKSLLLIGLGSVFVAQVFCQETPEYCTYQTYKWSTTQRKAVDIVQVQKHYSEVSADERDAETGCTVCQEDQVEVVIEGIPRFKVCKVLYPAIEAVFEKITDTGFPVEKVVTYRVGRTRGEADANGNRTQFSNHSFGIAIDINPQLNGLYDRCLEFSPDCRLIMGGKWQPEVPGTLTAESPVVKWMLEAGFKWGGQIAGRQKDFMHFSPGGY